MFVSKILVYIDVLIYLYIKLIYIQYMHNVYCLVFLKTINIGLKMFWLFYSIYIYSIYIYIYIYIYNSIYFIFIYQPRKHYLPRYPPALPYL